MCGKRKGNAELCINLYKVEKPRETRVEFHAVFGLMGSRGRIPKHIDKDGEIWYVKKRFY